MCQIRPLPEHEAGGASPTATGGRTLTLPEEGQVSILPLPMTHVSITYGATTGVDVLFCAATAANAPPEPANEGPWDMKSSLSAALSNNVR